MWSVKNPIFTVKTKFPFKMIALLKTRSDCTCAFIMISFFIKFKSISDKTWESVFLSYQSKSILYLKNEQGIVKHWLHDCSALDVSAPDFSYRLFHPQDLSPPRLFTPKTFHPQDFSPPRLFTPKTFQPQIFSPLDFSPPRLFTPKTFHPQVFSPPRLFTPKTFQPQMFHLLLPSHKI